MALPHITCAVVDWRNKRKRKIEEERTSSAAKLLSASLMSTKSARALGLRRTRFDASRSFLTAAAASLERFDADAGAASTADADADGLLLRSALRSSRAKSLSEHEKKTKDDFR